MADNGNNGTTIFVTHPTKKKLDDLKVHPREPYDELLDRMIEEVKKCMRKE